jgi:integrase
MPALAIMPLPVEEQEEEETIYHEGLDLDNCFSQEEADHIMSSCEQTIDCFLRGALTLYQTRQALFPWLGLSLGLRVSEIALLRLEDFNFQRDRITVWRFKKRGHGYIKGVIYSGGARMHMGLPAHIKGRMEAICQQLNRATGPILVTRNGKAASLGVLQWVWNMQVRPEFPFIGDRTIHAMRHTLGTLLARNSENRAGAAFTVNDGLGHSRKSIQVSAQYVSRDPEGLKHTVVKIFGNGDGKGHEELKAENTGQTEQLSAILRMIRSLSERIENIEKKAR